MWLNKMPECDRKDALKKARHFAYKFPARKIGNPWFYSPAGELFVVKIAFTCYFRTHFVLIVTFVLIFF